MVVFDVNDADDHSDHCSASNDVEVNHKEPLEFLSEIGVSCSSAVVLSIKEPPKMR